MLTVRTVLAPEMVLEILAATLRLEVHNGSTKRKVDRGSEKFEVPSSLAQSVCKDFLARSRGGF